MSKPSLEQLLASFDRAVQLRIETEALKPRLETEINDALASGDVLDENLAASLQIKRGQLELVPAKLNQLSAKSEELAIAIQPEFHCRLKLFTEELQTLRNAEAKRVLELFDQLGIDRLEAEAVAAQGVLRRTKLNTELVSLESQIRFQVSQQDIVGAARELVRREQELAEIKARPEVAAMIQTFGQKV